MTTHKPVETTNLDQYGYEALPWSAVVEALEDSTASSQDVNAVLGTVLPDGRPHAAGVGAMWIDGGWYIVSGPGTQKSHNLAKNPACTLAVRLSGFDVVFTGEAHRVTDAKELDRVAAVYRESGWPAEVEGDGFTAPYTAPSGGPPPWNVYRIDPQHAVGVGNAPSLSGATKWTFA
ncbi:MAG: pyridoxamine 5'-phosphate oxidase family protein [Acidimicrobiia bacterium]